MTGPRPTGIPEGLDLDSVAGLIATGLKSGLLPGAPGTWGSLAVLPLGVALIALGGTPAVLAGALIALAAGWWATGALTRELGAGGHDVDLGIIVIDEWAGQLIALAPAALAPVPIIAAFLLFRIFDVLKPWPVRWIERRLPGAAGVMLDDVAAGALAAVCVILLQRWLPGLV